MLLAMEREMFAGLCQDGVMLIYNVRVIKLNYKLSLRKKIRKISKNIIKVKVTQLGIYIKL